jgi:hypothetical protein
MQTKAFLTIPFVALVVAVTAQAAAASTYRHARTNEFAAEQLRHSNAYDASENIGSQSDFYARGATASPSDYYYLKGSCWDLGTCD